MTERPHRERAPREAAPVLYAAEPEPEPQGPVRVVTRGYALTGPRDAARRAARQDRVAERLSAGDPALWGADAEEVAANRLGWLALPTTSRELLPRLDALRDQLQAEGLTRVVLCGMGGSSLAPEVIAPGSLTVLDTTDPHQVQAALTDLEHTVVVVSSKSGTTLETDSLHRIWVSAFAAAGIDPAGRIVVVTDPGSPLTSAACRELFLAQPDVGGRYSALSAFGLVPAALAGADVTRLLDDAAAVLPDLAQPVGNPGLDLGAALGGNAVAGRDKVGIVTDELGAFGDWAEQLIAESTGKQGKGLLPVVGGYTGPDAHQVRTGAPAATATSVSGPLGAQFLVWEYATAVAAHVLKVNPFDEPNVAESKANTQRLLDEGWEEPVPDLVAGAVQVFGAGGSTVADAVDALLATIPATGYLAVMAYLDRAQHEPAGQLRALLAQRTARPVTFGWGPRFLHSTGQLHKGGPAVGCFLQLTGAVVHDVAVPDRPFSLGRLQMAQALGDRGALHDRGRPVLRLHLTDRGAGWQELLGALEPE